MNAHASRALKAPTQRRPWARALAWLVLLGPFFFLSYGFANAMAAGRTGVSSIVFDWEHAIPFWPWTIVPYWSIDVLYGISLALCRSRRELDIHAVRLFAVQLIAVACFLLFPLTFTFARPPASGVFGAMFDALAGFDKPFNQAPSLHIALLVVLWVRYARHVPAGAWRTLLHGWMALIGASVLTTYQHHFIDVPTGALAGWLVVWLWPEHGLAAPWQRAAFAHDSKRWRLALAYLSGAALMAALAAWLRGWAWWLLWPAVSLLLVAWCHAWCGAAGFQKRGDGRLTMAVRWLFAPYLAAAWINSRWWTRRRPRPQLIVDEVWLGRIPGRGERAGFDHVVDVCAELPMRDACADDAVVPMLDLVPPDARALRAAADAIAARQPHGRVLVCCALGYSRSALAVAAWLIASRRAADVDAAIATVRRAKPDVVIGDAQRAALRAAFDASRYEGDATRAHRESTRAHVP